MSERYTKLFSLPKNLYIPGAPVLLAAGALLKDNQTETTLAQLKFRSISMKAIKAVIAVVDAFDVSGAALGGVTEYQYLDLTAERDAEFGQRQAIPLPNANTRRIATHVVRAVFSDDTFWESDGTAGWLPLPEPTPVMAKLSTELTEQYRRDTTGNAAYLPEKLDGLWRCTCGALNWPEETTCHECGVSLDVQNNALNENILQEHLDAYIKERDEERAEQAAKAAETEKRAKRRNRIAAITLSSIAVITAAAVLISGAVRKNNAYQAAAALADAGQYEEAIAAFETLGDYKDSRERIHETKYNFAIALLREEQFEEAINVLQELGEYKNCIQLMQNAILERDYNRAIELLDKGQFGKARNAFAELGEYKDSAEYLSHFSYVVIKTKVSRWATGSGGYEYLGDHYEYYTYNDMGKIATKESQVLNLTTKKTATEKPQTTKTEYEYDDKGYLVRETHYISGSISCVYIYERVYDADGHLEKTELSDFNAEGELTRKETFLYNEQEQMIQATVFHSDSHYRIEYFYDDHGTMETFKYYDETDQLKRTRSYTIEYDAQGNLIFYGLPNDSTSIYTYDKNGNRLTYRYYFSTNEEQPAWQEDYYYDWMFFPDL